MPATEKRVEEPVTAGAGAFVQGAATPDEELVALYQDGDQRAVDVLLARYRNFARMKARSYFLVGADREDIVQEGHP